MSSRIFRDDILEGQVALVTGGGTGIGAAITRELGHQGASVYIASRKPEHIEPAARGLSEEIGRAVKAIRCDIRDRDSVAACVAEILAETGRLDILVNNGGGQFFMPAEHITPNGWDAVIATNLTGTWNMTRAAADGWMLEHGGRIINVTMLTKRTFPGMVHSVSARSGVEAMTRTLSVEWARRNIRINAVAPGFIASSGLGRYPAGLAVIEQMIPEIPLKRPGTPEEVAWMVAFLAGPAGDYITGQTFTVDGGKELWGDYWPIEDPEDMPKLEIPKEPWEE